MSYGGGGGYPGGDGGGYYGGGGGYGDDRKRRREDDRGGDQNRYRRDSGGGGGRGRWRDNDERRFDRRAQHPPQPRGPGRKPRTKEDEIMAQIKALLVKMGDFNLISSSLSSLEENVEGLANALAGELGTWGAFISDYVVTCAAQLPMQTSGYATLVGLLNAKDEEFGDKVVKRAGYKLQEFISLGRWINAKLMLRFLAELVNARTVVAEGEGSLGDLLTQLMGPVQDETVSGARKDLYVYLVASTLPWVWETLAKEWPDKFPALVRSVVDYGAGRSPHFRKDGLRSLLEAKLEEDDDGEPVVDTVQSAIAAVEQLAPSVTEEGMAVSTDISAIPKPWVSVKEELSQGRRHSIPVVTLPDPDPMPADPKQHDLCFHPAFADFELFDTQSGDRPATLATLAPLDRWVMRDYLRDMLVTYRPFVTEAGVKRGSFRAESEQLLSLSYFAPEQVATEFLVVEALLLWLLQLPGRDLPYLHRLLIDFVGYGEKPAGALLLGTTLLVQNYAELLDHVALTQLADWFGSHLINTQLKLPEATWRVFGDLVSEFESEPDHPSLYFLRRALDVAVRLTYLQFVKDRVPDERLHALLPGQPYARSPYLPAGTGPDPSPDDPPHTRVLKQLIGQFKGVVTDTVAVEQVKAWLDAEHPGLSDAEDPLWRVTLVAHGISAVMDNTICHMASLLEKSMVWLRDMMDDDDAQHRLLDALSQVWDHNPQMLLILVNDMMRKHIVLPINVVQWVVRDDHVKRLGHDPRHWDLLRDAVDRSFESVSNYADPIRVEVEAAHAASNPGATVNFKDESLVRSVVGHEKLEAGQVSAENAQDVAMELVEKMVTVLSDALSSEGESAREQHWFRALLSYLRNLLVRYLDVQNSPFNEFMPLAEPIFLLDKAREGVEQHLAKHALLRGIFDDAQGFLDRKEQLGGAYSHGQMFSEE